MSMYWDHRCSKCGKEFASFSPKATTCYVCTEVVKIRDLPERTIVKIVPASGEYKEATLFACDLKFFGDRNVYPKERELVLETNEIAAFENHIGRKLIWESKKQ